MAAYHLGIRADLAASNDFFEDLTRGTATARRAYREWVISKVAPALVRVSGWLRQNQILFNQLHQEQSLADLKSRMADYSLARQWHDDDFRSSNPRELLSRDLCEFNPPHIDRIAVAQVRNDLARVAIAWNGIGRRKGNTPKSSAP